MLRLEPSQADKMPRSACTRANTCLRVMSQNVQQLSDNKEEELIGKIYSERIHVMCLQETWRHEATQWSNNECTVITNGPSKDMSRIGKGVAILLGPQATKAWRASGERTLRYGERIVAVQFELKVKRKTHHVRIVSAYAPHSGYPQNVREEYLSQLEACVNDCSSFERLIIGTDTNASIGIRNSNDLVDRVRGPYGIEYENECGRSLYQLLAMQELCLPTTFFKAKKKRAKHTWRGIRTRKPFQIDHIIVKRSDLKRVRSARTYNRGVDSDHRAILIQYQLHGIALTQRKIKERLDRELLTFCPPAVADFTASVSETMSKTAELNDGVENGVEDRFSALQKAVEKAACEAIMVDTYREPWFKLASSRLLPLIQKRDLLQSQYDKTPTANIKRQHRRVKSALARQENLAKKQWVNMTVLKVLKKVHRGVVVTPREVWGHIREIQRGPRATTIIHPMKLYREDKTVSTDPKENHEIMTKYLTTVFNTTRSYDAEVINSIPLRRKQEWMNASPTFVEVKNATLKLSNGKSGGSAHIPAEYYKALLTSPDTCNEIYNIITKFWESGSYASPSQTQYKPLLKPTSVTEAINGNWRVRFHPTNVRNHGKGPYRRYESFKHTTTFSEAKLLPEVTNSDLKEAITNGCVEFLYPIQEEQDLSPLKDDSDGIRLKHWEVALLRLLPKKGDLSLPKNWRGICLLDVASKILSSVIVARLSRLFEEVGPQEQNGFRHHRGTIDGLFEVLMALNKRQEHNQQSWVLFIDLVKAFDTVNHEALFIVLRRYGAPDHFVNLVIRLHDSASMSFAHGGEKSNVDVTIGVRQGSCEGPVLFLFMILAALETLPLTTTKPVFTCRKSPETINGQKWQKRAIHFDFSHSLFADDCAFIFASRNDLVSGTEVINTHLKKCGLLMHVGRGTNKSKTEAMYIPTNVNPFGNTSKFTVDGDGFVEFTDEFKYLGTMISNTLTMSNEITSRIRKASAAFGALSRIFKDKTLTLTVKGQVYSVLITTILLYGCEAWNLSKSDETRLRTFHRRCIRSILNTTPLKMKWQKIRTNQQEEILGVNCVVDNYRWRLLKWAGHVSRMPTTNLQWRMMTCCVQGTRSIGRPTVKWGHAVNRALKARDISEAFHEWSELAQDEEKWTSLIQPKKSKDKKKRYYCSIFKERVHKHRQHATTSPSQNPPPPCPPPPPSDNYLNTYHSLADTLGPTTLFPTGVFNAGRSSESRNAIRVAPSSTTRAVPPPRSQTTQSASSTVAEHNQQWIQAHMPD